MKVSQKKRQYILPDLLKINIDSEISLILSSTPPANDWESTNLEYSPNEIFLV